MVREKGENATRGNIGRCIGIDPATETGIAYRDRNGQWVTASGPGDSVTWIHHVIEAAYDEGIRYALIEDTYMKRNVKVVKRLSEIRGMWIGALLAHDVKVQTVAASTWKSHQLRVNGTLPEKRTDQKKLSIELCRSVHGVETKSNDIADAVHIADYGNNLIRLEIWE